MVFNGNNPKLPPPVKHNLEINIESTFICKKKDKKYTGFCQILYHFHLVYNLTVHNHLLSE